MINNEESEEGDIAAEFNLPKPLLDRVYSLSGSPDKHKGMLLVYISQNGNPVVYSKFDDRATEIAIVSTAETYIKQLGMGQFLASE